MNTLRQRAQVGLWSLCFLVACGTTEPSVVPPGDGLISCDSAPPKGIDLVMRPELKTGDTFTYRKGGKIAIELRIVEKTAAGYSLAEASSGLVRHYNLDLAQLGESLGDDKELRSRMLPQDDRLTWPLWVGKHWTSNFSKQATGMSPMAITAAYHCDAQETIEVGMREFRCFRIWRRANRGQGDRFLELVSVSWYSPEVGQIVREITDGLLTELTAFHRQ